MEEGRFERDNKRRAGSDPRHPTMTGRLVPQAMRNRRRSGPLGRVGHGRTRRVLVRPSPSLPPPLERALMGWAQGNEGTVHENRGGFLARLFNHE